jgi:NAD(P)-dependent dehydrogenase (short-subunit alcohol dehydrogenase family)
MLKKSVWSNEEFVKTAIAGTPLRRIGQAADVAQAILSVMTMDWVTGQVIAADGGASLTTPRDHQLRVAVGIE